nr:hypothetical protein [Tanacetum cinerariifolium]
MSLLVASAKSKVSSESITDSGSCFLTKLVLDMFVDEPLVLGRQLVQCMIADELGHHMVMVVEEMCGIVEQLVNAVGDTVMDYIEADDCFSMEVCCRN